MPIKSDANLTFGKILFCVFVFFVFDFFSVDLFIICSFIYLAANSKKGAGLTNKEYAGLCEITGECETGEVVTSQTLTNKK